LEHVRGDNHSVLAKRGGVASRPIVESVGGLPVACGRPSEAETPKQFVHVLRSELLNTVRLCGLSMSALHPNLASCAGDLGDKQSPWLERLYPHQPAKPPAGENYRRPSLESANYIGGALLCGNSQKALRRKIVAFDAGHLIELRLDGPRRSF